jgi:Serine aminopeptidase, S33
MQRPGRANCWPGRLLSQVSGTLSIVAAELARNGHYHINGEAMAKTRTHDVQSMSYHVASVVDGSALSVRQWMPPPEVNTRAVLQLTQGISEHSGRYERFARFLAENGFRVYASDLRGHGLSVPQSEFGKASVHFWADTTADMKQLLDLMHRHHGASGHVRHSPRCQRTSVSGRMIVRVFRTDGNQR